MWELIVMGGWMMVPIGLCSVLAVALTVERCIYLWIKRSSFEDLFRAIQVPLQEGRVDQARENLEHYSGLLPELVRKGLNGPLNSDAALERMEEYALQIIPKMERSLPSLNIIAQVTPLLGLLGTVAGMIQAFAAVAEAGLGQPELLAGGIFQALITTAAGLSVGIPTLVVYHLLSRRVDQEIHKMERGTRRVVNLLEDLRGGKQSS